VPVLAVPHFYWGVDGTADLDTAVNRRIVEHRDGWFLALNWGVGLLCVCGGVVVLATVRPLGPPSAHLAPARPGLARMWAGHPRSTSTSSSGSA